jgi:hypothetical protein
VDKAANKDPIHEYLNSDIFKNLQKSSNNYYNLLNNMRLHNANFQRPTPKKVSITYIRGMKGATAIPITIVIMSDILLTIRPNKTITP